MLHLMLHPETVIGRITRFGLWMKGSLLTIFEVFGWFRSVRFFPTPEGDGYNFVQQLLSLLKLKHIQQQFLAESDDFYF